MPPVGNCCIDEQLREEIALRVTATDPVDLIAHRREEVDNTAILAITRGNDGAAERQSNIPENWPLRRAGLCRGLLHRCQHLGNIAIPPGASQRHDVVRVVEDEEMVVDMLRANLAEFFPTPADIKAAHLETREHRDCVSDINMIVRRLFAELGIVKVKHLHEVFPLQVKKRQVPPRVIPEVINIAPVAAEPLKPFNAFLVTAGHFHSVRHRVSRPSILRIDLNRFPPRRFSQRIKPRLFKTERLDAFDEAIGRDRGIPGVHHPVHRIPHALHIAEIKMQKMREPQRQNVVRILQQD